LADFYVLPGDTPQIEHELTHGELITAVEVPFLPAGARSRYLKVREVIIWYPLTLMCPTWMSSSLVKLTRL